MDSVKCYYYKVSELADESLFQKGMRALPWESRRQKVDRLRFASDKQLSLGAGLMAARLLKEAGATDLTLSFGENEKPRLSSHPDIHFNLSHSGTIAVCAIADQPVGIDVEKLQSANYSISRRFFRQEEQQYLEVSADPDRTFTRLWTRKESYLKLLGTGLSKELNSFSVLPLETDPSRGASEEMYFAELEVEEHRICVCTGRKAEVIFLPFSLNP